ncbi:hypothetical protein Tco_0569678 [Tanacetum coccineum]
MITNFDELNEDECFDSGESEIVLSSNVENDDSFTFVIRTFLPFLTYHADSPLLLSIGSEDTIFDPGYLDFKDSCAHGFVHLFELRTDIKEMDKNKDKADKTEHENEKSARKRVQRVTSLSRDWKLIENTSCASALSMKWTNNSLTRGYGKIYIFKFISSQVAKEICWLIFDAYKVRLPFGHVARLDRLDHEFLQRLSEGLSIKANDWPIDDIMIGYNLQNHPSSPL